MPELNWAHEPLSEAFQSFKARMTLYLEDKEITDAAKQATKIKIAIGDEGICRVLASGLTDEDRKKPEKIWTLLEEQLDATTHINYRVHRLELSNMLQKPGESITEYVMPKKLQGDELSERLIEMIIISTPFDEIRKELLAKPKGYGITTVLARGREYEALQASEISLKSMYQATASPPSVDAIRKFTNTCSNCGRHHPPRKCLAYLLMCGACGSKGHWQQY